MDQRQPDEPAAPEPEDALPDDGEPNRSETDDAAGASEDLAPAQAGDNAPLGGDRGTENELEADNAVEEDMLKALDPDAAPG